MLARNFITPARNQRRTLNWLQHITAAVEIALATACLPLTVHGAISFQPGGYTEVWRFDIASDAADWSTRSVDGGSVDFTSFAALHAAAVTNVATAIAGALQATTAPGTAALARWVSTGQYLVTRPAGVGYTVLLAHIQNNSGQNWSQVSMEYTLAVENGAIEQIPGHLVYYSLTGEANSWQFIPELSTNSTPGWRGALLNFPRPWTPGNMLYVMWVDDNGSPTDEALEIDNFWIAQGDWFDVRIDRQPTGTNTVEGQRVTLSVTASGRGPMFYQWFKDGSPVSGTTASAYIIPSMTAGDAGTYFVEVNNSSTRVRSDDAIVTYQAVPPTITNDLPITINLLEGRDATLTVGMSGPNLKFQWFHNGDPANRSTTATYLITNAVPADGGSYYVVVTNTSGAVTSRVAQANYSEDTAAPSIVLASYKNAGTRITVTFNEPLSTAPNDLDFFNVSVAQDASGPALTVHAAYVTNSNQVIVETDPRDPSAAYRIVFSNTVVDLFGNRITTESSLVLPESVFQQGINGYAGTQDTELRGGNGSNATPQGPRADFINVDTSDGNPAGPSHGLVRFDDFIGNSSGQIPPGATIRTATLRLFSSASSANGNRVSMHRVLQDWNQATATWDSFDQGIAANDIEAAAAADASWVPTNTPPFEMLISDSNLVATVQAWVDGRAPNYGWAILPTGSDGYRIDPSEHAVTNNRPSLSVVYELLVCTCPPIFLQQPPPNVTISEGQSFSLSVLVSSASPVWYQWFKNGQSILGATNATYSVASAHPVADNGTYFVRVTNAVGWASSSNSSVQIPCDCSKPQVLSAFNSSYSNTTITVTFDQPMETSSAENLSNYQLNSSAEGSVITNATANGTTVSLQLSGPLPWTYYTLTVSGVRDRAETPNTIETTNIAIRRIFALISSNSTWQFLQQTVPGSPAPCLDGEQWTMPNYNSSSWQTGRGIFYGVRGGTNLPIVLDGAEVQTLLNVFTNSSPANQVQEVTYYFRTAFSFPFLDATLRLRTMVDDGAVFYLDGKRIHDVRLTNNLPLCTAFARSAGGQNWEPPLNSAAIEVTGLRCPDSHLLAVEVHQNSSTSSDITLGVVLEAELTSFAIPAPLPPRLSAVRRGNTLELSWPTAGCVSSPLLYEAAAVDGPYAPRNDQTSPQFITTTNEARFYRLQY
jgi:hypothetical protein